MEAALLLIPLLFTRLDPCGPGERWLRGRFHGLERGRSADHRRKTVRFIVDSKLANVDAV